MTVLDKVKLKVGIFYSDPLNDAKIQSYINSATTRFKNAGWKASLEDDFATDAFAIYVNIMLSNDSEKILNINSNPILVDFITQARYSDDTEV